MVKKRVNNKSTGRDYSYDLKYQSSPEQIKNRTARNAARRKLMAGGKVRVGDGKDVNHKDSNPRNNKSSNLSVESRSKNRGRMKNGKRV